MADNDKRVSDTERVVAHCARHEADTIILRTILNAISPARYDEVMGMMHVPSHEPEDVPALVLRFLVLARIAFAPFPCLLEPLVHGLQPVPAVAPHVEDAEESSSSSSSAVAADVVDGDVKQQTQHPCPRCANGSLLLPLRYGKSFECRACHYITCSYPACMSVRANSAHASYCREHLNQRKRELYAERNAWERELAEANARPTKKQRCMSAEEASAMEIEEYL